MYLNWKDGTHFWLNSRTNELSDKSNYHNVDILAKCESVMTPFFDEFELKSSCFRWVGNRISSEIAPLSLLRYDKGILFLKMGTLRGCWAECHWFDSCPDLIFPMGNGLSVEDFHSNCYWIGTVSAKYLHFEVILELHPLIDSLIGPMFPTSKNIKNSGSMPWILFQPRFSSCYEYLGHSDKLLNITVSSSLNLLPEISNDNIVFTRSSVFE